MSGGSYPAMPFNQQMTVPRVLTLRTTPEGVRLFMEPVEELERLRGKERAWQRAKIAPGENLLSGVSGELFDIAAEIAPGDAKQVGFEIRGQKVEYSPADKKLTALGRTAPLALADGRLKLRILVDRASVEVFANDGRVQMATCFVPPPEKRGLSLSASGGAAEAVSLKVWEMRSAWKK
jgi:sucrose-6-phosphate hydrolase SacC (GH32 family)